MEQATKPLVTLPEDHPLCYKLKSTNPPGHVVEGWIEEYFRNTIAWLGTASADTSGLQQASAAASSSSAHIQPAALSTSARLETEAVSAISPPQNHGNTTEQISAADSEEEQEELTSASKKSGKKRAAVRQDVEVGTSQEHHGYNTRGNKRTKVTNTCQALSWLDAGAGLNQARAAADQVVLSSISEPQEQPAAPRLSVLQGSLVQKPTAKQAPRRHVRIEAPSAERAVLNQVRASSSDFNPGTQTCLYLRTGKSVDIGRMQTSDHAAPRFAGI